MSYALMEPLFGLPDGSEVGRCQQIFDTYEEAVQWCEENCKNPKYQGWYVTIAEGLRPAMN